jgi:hypothetical protein
LSERPLGVGKSPPEVPQQLEADDSHLDILAHTPCQGKRP